jgi:hypothetical protein
MQEAAAQADASAFPGAVVRREEDPLEKEIKERAAAKPPPPEPPKEAADQHEEEEGLIDTISQASHRIMTGLSNRLFGGESETAAPKVMSTVDEAPATEAPAAAPLAPAAAPKVAIAPASVSDEAPAQAESDDGSVSVQVTQPPNRRRSVTQGVVAVARAPAKGVRRISAFVAGALDDIIGEVDSLIGEEPTAAPQRGRAAGRGDVGRSPSSDGAVMVLESRTL